MKVEGRWLRKANIYPRQKKQLVQKQSVLKEVSGTALMCVYQKSVTEGW